jgi:hypothetical protein
MGFVDHFVLSLRTFSRVRMAPSVRFSLRATEDLSIFARLLAQKVAHRQRATKACLWAAGHSLLRLPPGPDQALELLSEAPHEKSAIVKPDRDTTIITALDNLANLTAQRHFGFPGKCSGNKLDPIAYLETAISLRITCIHLPLPTARARQGAFIRVHDRQL